MIEYLGWIATAVFVASYFCARPETIKRVQMAGALMWATYGLVIGASPVVVANLLVFGAAAWTLVRNNGIETPANERSE
jgi:inner membrane protein